MALAVSLKFNPPSPTLPFLVAEEIEATVIRVSTRILFQVIFKGEGKGVLKAMELRALCPFFVIYFLIATAVYGDDRAHLFECERGFWYCPIWSRAQKH